MTEPAPATAAPPKSGWRVLREQTPPLEGPDVQRVQAWLADRGITSPRDGRYERATADAVKAVQHDLDLNVDGIVGPDTWAALELSPSVSRILGQLVGDVTPAAVVAELLKQHTEYGGGHASALVLDSEQGPRAPAVEWLARARGLLDPGKPIQLHGRVVIEALARLDRGLADQLAAGGFRKNLEDEISEPLDSLFTGPAPPAPIKRERVGDMSGSAAADLPASEDLLGFAPLVRALRALLDDPRTALPLALAITGKWGAGKSSVMRQLEAAMRADGGAQRRWRIVRFDAWKYERSERLWAALAKAIYDQGQRHMGLSEKLAFRVRLEWRRLGWWKFMLRFLWPTLAAAAAVAALLAADLSTASTAALGLGSIAGLAAIAAQYWGAIANPYKRAVERHASHPDYEEQLGFTSEADHDIACLTAVLTAGERRALAIFVDDLDRCSAAHVVEVVEAMNQIFNSDERVRDDGDLPGHSCAFVLGLDREVVATSIVAAYDQTVARLTTAMSPLATEFGQQFLAKLVQLSLGVPRPSPASMETLLESVTASRRVQPVAIADPDELAATAARERIRTSTEILDAEFEALLHLESNPRQVKRFHNVFLLQLYVAAEGGLQFDGDPLRALARWVALRLRWPRLADALDQEPFLLTLLETKANEEEPPEQISEGERLRLEAGYKGWFADQRVATVLREPLRARRVTQLPVDKFLPVA